jgi:preprotein translocase subunit SecE
MSISPAKFFREVRSEAIKITWPTRKETGVTTAMVFVFVLIASFFFLAVDGVIAYAVRHIMGW